MHGPAGVRRRTGMTSASRPSSCAVTESEGELPDWRDPAVGGARVRIALWLVSEVGEGEVFSKQQLRNAVPSIEQVDRRMRDLRSAGWVIDTYRDAVGLKPGELRLKRIGLPVWEEEHRSAGLRQISATTRRRVFERDGHRCVRCGITPGESYPGLPSRVARLTLGHIDPHKLGTASTEEHLVTECDRCNEPVKHLTGVQVDDTRVWDQIVELPRKDKTDLAKWIEFDRRPPSKVELVWALYRQLSASHREEIRARLNEALGRGGNT